MLSNAYLKTVVLSMFFILSSLVYYEVTNSTNFIELLLLAAIAVWIPSISESLSRRVSPNYKRKVSGVFTLIILFMLIAFYNYRYGFDSLNILVWGIITVIVSIMWIFISK